MPLPVDLQISQLADGISESVRSDLQQALRTLRDAGDVGSTLVSVARLFEGKGGLLEQVAQSSGMPTEGHNLDMQITKLAEKGIIPPLIASNLHWIRIHANKARHRDETVALTLDDAETSLNRALRVVRWYYCEFPSGPRLPAIGTSAPRRRQRRWVALAGLAVVIIALAAFFVADRNSAGKQQEEEPGKQTASGKVEDKTLATTDKTPPLAEEAVASPKSSAKPAQETKEPPRPPAVKKTVLNNDGSPSLVLKEIKERDNPLASVIDLDNHLGLAEVGADVRLVAGVEEIPTPNPFLRFRKVEILSGQLKGKMGWVSSNVIRLVD